MTITDQTLSAYRKTLIAAERATATIEKYMSNLTSFATWLGNRPLEKEYMLLWRSEMETRYSPASVNAIISSMNGFLRFLGRPDCVLKFLKVQKRVFRDKKRNLTREEYEQLVNTAYRCGKERLGLLMEAIGSTGIRVSEVQYITVEALQAQKVITQTSHTDFVKIVEQSG
jgi:site-specific recombinase XerD